MNENVTHVYSVSTNASKTITNSLKAYSVTAEYDTFTNLRGDNGDIENVSFDAQWTPNIYTISYVLDNSDVNDPYKVSHEFNPSSTGAWEIGDSHVDLGIYNQSFIIVNPSKAPLGYKFVGWRIESDDLSSKILIGKDNSELTEVSTGEDGVHEITDISIQCFKNLTPVGGAHVTFTALWEALKYNISYKYINS